MTTVLHTPAIPTASVNAPKGQPKLLAWALLTASLYFVCAMAGTYISRQPGHIATLWYADAVAVCLLLARHQRQWPVLLLAAGLANLAANLATHRVMHQTLPLSLAFLPGNLGGITLAAWLLRRHCNIEQSLSQVSMLLRVWLLGGLIPSLAGACIGAASLTLIGAMPFSSLWLSWVASTAIGYVSVFPLGCLLLSGRSKAIKEALKTPRVLTVIILAAVTACLAPMYVPFAFAYVWVALVLVAVVGGLAGAAVAVLLCSLTAGTLLTTGQVHVPAPGSPIGQFLFYVPLILTLTPPMLLATTLDRSKRVMAELTSREDHFRRLYLKAPVMMHSIDPQGYVVSVNDAWLVRMGYARDEVLGRKSIEFLTPDSRQYATHVVLPRFARDGMVSDIEYQFVTKYGEIVDVMLSAIWERDSQGQPLRSMAVSKDVSQHKRLAAQLAVEQERIQVTLHAIADGVVTTDEQGLVSYMNPVAQRLTGWSLDDARGRPVQDVVHVYATGEDELALNPVAKCLQHRSVYGLPEGAVLRSLQGHEHHVRSSVAPITGHDNALLGSVAVFQDVTHSRAISQKMSYLAQHDALTGLPNRVLFQDRVHQACQFGLRNQGRFAVAFMDVDHFKHVNDSLGHVLGDDLLKTVAERLRQTLRGSDSVCRLGGDEFVMLLADIRSVEDVGEIAKKILRQVCTPCVLANTEINVSLSLGVAVFPDDGHDPDTLMKHADAAMYRAKREGRNRFHFFSKAVDEAASARLQLEADMRRGLAEGQFSVHYQPIVDSVSQRAVAVEALTRWTRGTQGMQSPAIFIPVAEESGLIVALGEMVLRKACDQLRTWAGTSLEKVTIAVNVSTIQLAQPGFVDTVRNVLTSSGVDGHQLEFEITESTLMHDPQATLEVLNQLKALGIRIAIDDFGTGYSSLSYLKRFPVDTVKIDRAFVRDLESDHDDRELVKAIMAMAKSLRLHVVAEGVETPAQAEVLAAMDCQYLQGFMFAKPADARTTTAWLQERTSSLPS